jgi:hypothetical protein
MVDLSYVIQQGPKQSKEDPMYENPKVKRAKKCLRLMQPKKKVKNIKLEWCHLA